MLFKSLGLRRSPLLCFHPSTITLQTSAAPPPPPSPPPSSLVVKEDFWVSTLQECSTTQNLLLGKTVHARVLRTSSFPHMPLFLANHILNMYLKCSSPPSYLENGIAHFKQIQNPNTITYSILMSAFARHDLPDKCISLFVQMKRYELSPPNHFTYASCLQACSFIKDGGHLLDQVYGCVVKSGFDWNGHVKNSLLSGLIRSGRLCEAVRVFEECSDKNDDIVFWNALLAGHAQLKCEQVPEFWLRMVRVGIKLDGYSFSSVLNGLREISDIVLGFQVHGQVEKLAWKEERCVGDSLFDMYLQNGLLEEGLRVFYEMPKNDVKSWTMVAFGCLRCGEPRKAIEMVREMRKTGIFPNEFTLATAFHACANATSLEEGRKIHGLRIKFGSEMDVCVDNASIDMYMKCGCLDAARSIFESMEERSVITWTTMIIGCAQNGQPQEAIEAFDEMVREGKVHPNNVTYVGVLYACSQGGFVDEGWKYFACMSNHHGIVPSEDHYACMANLLGRAGHVREAEELILSMPMQPSVVIWQTLLAAALVHGDMETAKRASEHALDSDVKDPSTYVLLSNVFAGVSKWQSVGVLRELMENRDVNKIPGSSWVELASPIREDQVTSVRS